LVYFHRLHSQPPPGRPIAVPVVPSPDFHPCPSTCPSLHRISPSPACMGPSLPGTEPPGRPATGGAALRDGRRGPGPDPKPPGRPHHRPPVAPHRAAQPAPPPLRHDRVISPVGAHGEPAILGPRRGGGRTPCLLPTPPPSLAERRGTGVSTICPTAVTHGVIFFLRKDISRREVPHPPGCPHPIVGDDLVDDPEAPVEPSGARYRGRGLFLHCVLLDLPHPSAPDGRGPQPGIRRPPSLSPWRSHTQSFLTSGGQDG